METLVTWETHDLFFKPSGYLESLITTLLALLTNLLVSELCSAGENAVNQAVLGSKNFKTTLNYTKWIVTNKMSAIQIEDWAAAIASKSEITWEFIIEMNLSLYAMQSDPEHGSLNCQTLEAFLMVYTMSHPTHVYYRRPHVGIIPLTAQDHHCHTLRSPASPRLRPANLAGTGAIGHQATGGGGGIRSEPR